MSNNQKIEHSSDLRKYRTELPNLYDDSDLDPYEFRLLAHYVRRGDCYEGVRATSKFCKMSIGKVVSTRESLREKGFITTLSGKPGFDTIVIEVVDMWDKNFLKYAGCSPHEQGVHHMNTRCSPHELKKEPLKTKKEEPIFSFPELWASSPEFMAAWGNFVEHRKEKRKKITPRAGHLLIKKLISYSIPVGIAALDKAVESDWIGVFPESIKLEQNGQADRKTTMTENGMYL